MEVVSAIVTALASAVLFVFAYAFAPWRGNLLGETALLGIPVWAACLVLALGLTGVAARLLRRALTERRSPA